MKKKLRLKNKPKENSATNGKNERKSNKNLLAIIAIIIAILALACSFLFGKFIEITIESIIATIVALMAIATTFVVGFQIWNFMSFKKELDAMRQQLSNYMPKEEFDRVIKTSNNLDNYVEANISVKITEIISDYYLNNELEHKKNILYKIQNLEEYAYFTTVSEKVLFFLNNVVNQSLGNQSELCNLAKDIASIYYLPHKKSYSISLLYLDIIYNSAYTYIKENNIYDLRWSLDGYGEVYVCSHPYKFFNEIKNKIDNDYYILETALGECIKQDKDREYYKKLLKSYKEFLNNQKKINDHPKLDNDLYMYIESKKY